MNNTYRVIAPTSTGHSALTAGKVIVGFVLLVAMIIGLRWLGETRMDARIEARQAQAVASMVTVQATPIPTPTPIAPTLVSAGSVTLDTGLGYSLQYEMQTVSDGVRLTDPDGDLWLCATLPATHTDWQACKYVGTIQ